MKEQKKRANEEIVWDKNHTEGFVEELGHELG